MLSSNKITKSTAMKKRMKRKNTFGAHASENDKKSVRGICTCTYYYENFQMRWISERVLLSWKMNPFLVVSAKTPTVEHNALKKLNILVTNFFLLTENNINLHHLKLLYDHQNYFPEIHLIYIFFKPSTLFMLEI